MNNIADYAETLVDKTRWQLGLTQSGEWCAETVSHILEKTVDPNKEVYDFSCNNMKKKMKDSDNWEEPNGPIQRGDVFFFDHDRGRDPLKDSKPLDHVGIVTGFGAGYITYIDGNGDSSGYVRRRTRPISDFDFDCEYPDYYMRYCGKGTEEKPFEEPKSLDEYTDVNNIRILKKGCKGKDVEAMQAILIQKGYSCGRSMADSDFGSNTEKAVMNFQNDHKLSPSGICDQKTWQELINR